MSLDDVVDMEEIDGVIADADTFDETFCGVEDDIVLLSLVDVTEP